MYSWGLLVCMVWPLFLCGLKRYVSGGITLLRCTVSVCATIFFCPYMLFLYLSILLVFGDDNTITITQILVWVAFCSSAMCLAQGRIRYCEICHYFSTSSCYLLH
uniref:Uncharacterized protein n=1 Tax=Trypanosoma vivax (strain Y486) TaxID=1055687 RepID=G0U2U3_TRYVY|nr:hypothetical protein TVY486_0904180 [Trypanosoma vivax Y486]